MLTFQTQTIAVNLMAANIRILIFQKPFQAGAFTSPVYQTQKQVRSYYTPPIRSYLTSLHCKPTMPIHHVK